MELIDSLGKEISLHRPTVNRWCYQQLCTLISCNRFTWQTDLSELHVRERIIDVSVNHCDMESFKTFKAGGDELQGGECHLHKVLTYRKFFIWSCNLFSQCNAVVCMTIQYVCDLMNAAFFYGCASHPAIGNLLMHSSSHQMTNETLPVVELFICFCWYNKGYSCWKCWFTVAFSLLCVEIFLSQAWELQSETLLCLSSESYIFSSRDQNAKKQQLIETCVWSLYFILSIHPSIHPDHNKSNNIPRSLWFL